MERTYTGVYPTTAKGYLSAGVNVPMVESRGKLLLVIDNTWGTLDLGGGSIRTDVPNALPPTSTLQLGAGTSIDLNGNSQTVSQIKRGAAAAGTRVVTNSLPATLTVSGYSSPTFDGVLTGALGLTKAGSSTLALLYPNAYSGATTVSGGTLQIAAASNLGNSRAVQVTGGTLRLQSASALLDDAVVRISGSGKVRVDSGAETVGALYLGDKRQRRGTYGPTASTAHFKSDTYFTAGTTGILNVLHGPECVLLIK